MGRGLVLLLFAVLASCAGDKEAPGPQLCRDAWKEWCEHQGLCPDAQFTPRLCILAFEAEDRESGRCTGTWGSPGDLGRCVDAIWSQDCAASGAGIYNERLRPVWPPECWSITWK
jgi:hypothetical protein